MTTPRYKLGRAFSARRLILLATAGNLAIAALLVGPDFPPLGTSNILGGKCRRGRGK